MITFTRREEKILSAIGNSNRGPQFIEILERLSRETSAVDTITEGDYGAQVEGRKLFKKTLGLVISILKQKPTGPPGIDEASDDFE